MVSIQSMLGTLALCRTLCVSPAWRQSGAAVVARQTASIAVRGHGGDRAALMGFFDRDGEADGVPRYRSRHPVALHGAGGGAGARVVLRRDASGVWGAAVGEQGEVVVRSRSAGAAVPLGLAWEVARASDGGWEADAALGVDGAAGMPRVPAAVALHGHTGVQRALMGFYERDGEANGFPRYKARHQAGGKELFLYRSSGGRWVVGSLDGIARNNGRIKSSTCGSLVPLGLPWEVHTGSSWQADAALRLNTVANGPAMPAVVALHGHTGTHNQTSACLLVSAVL